MTFLNTPRLPGTKNTNFAMAPRLPSTPALVIFGLLFVTAIGFGRLQVVWNTGAYFDSDDAMRLVQVRDFMSGQGWFDLSVSRLVSSDHMVIHWSRVIDIPLASLTWLFSLFASADMAERQTRITFPLLIYACLFFGMIRLSRSILGRESDLACVILTALTGIIWVQFSPGRIDHHAPQITLLVFMAASTIATVRGQDSRNCLYLGFLAALSLAISLENLPFIAAAIALILLRWIIIGQPMAAALIQLATGLSLAGAILFLATVPPPEYLQGACDAFSSAHLLAIFSGSLALVTISTLPALHKGPGFRLFCTLAAGALLSGIMLAAYPACLGDPLANIDPVLRDVWLSHVLEARPLILFVKEHPELFLAVIFPVFLGVPFILAAALKEKGDIRQAWIAISGFALIGCLTAFWQIRALSSLAPISLLGGVWFLRKLQGKLSKWPIYLVRIIVCVCALPFCSIFWVLIASPKLNLEEQDKLRAKAACLAPAAFASLNNLPNSLVLAPIDLGSHLLALTRHSVVAAPYHRNNSGNRSAVDFFLSGEAAGHSIFDKTGAKYILVCPAMTELKDYALMSPNGLASLILANNVPGWLHEVDIAEDGFRLFETR